MTSSLRCPTSDSTKRTSTIFDLHTITLQPPYPTFIASPLTYHVIISRGLSPHHPSLKLPSTKVIRLTFPSPKIRNLEYSDERDWASPPPPALHRQISRETSLASLRSPITVAFPGHANVGSNIPPPSPGYYHRHKSSTFSTGPGSTDWVSRQGWTPGTSLGTGSGIGPAAGSIHVQGRFGGGSQLQGRGVGGHGYGYGGPHDDGLEVEFEEAHHYFGSKFPPTDPSSVAF